jgi:hypothetical protein
MGTSLNVGAWFSAVRVGLARMQAPSARANTVSMITRRRQ